jgi:hypothetical protein
MCHICAGSPIYLVNSLGRMKIRRAGLLLDCDSGHAVAPADQGAGDAEAFALLYRRYVHNVYAYSFNRLGDDGTARFLTDSR